MPEIGSLIAIGGSLLVIAIPAFINSLSFSRLSEPIQGLQRLSANAIAYSESKPFSICFPPSSPLTPSQVPRGKRTKDPEKTWEHLTWKSLDFRFDYPHFFSFQFDSKRDETGGKATFTSKAFGDLDGDGDLSTFEVNGEKVNGDPARILPGMFIDREVE